MLGQAAHWYQAYEIDEHGFLVFRSPQKGSEVAIDSDDHRPYCMVLAAEDIWELSQKKWRKGLVRLGENPNYGEVELLGYFTERARLVTELRFSKPLLEVTRLAALELGLEVPK